MPKITYQQLRDHGACAEQRELFKTTFGESVEVTVEAAVAVANDFDFDWAVCELLNSDAYDEYDAMIRPVGATYHELWKAEFEKIKPIRKAANDEYDAATHPFYEAYSKAVLDHIATEDIAAAQKSYNRAIEAAHEVFQRRMAEPSKAFSAVIAPALEEYNRETARAFATCYIKQEETDACPK